MTAKKPNSTRTKKPVTPGDRLRAAIEAEFELSEGEGLLLDKACATADLLERVEAEVATAPLVESGSRHQPVSNPLIRTQMELQQHLVMLLQAMRLPLGEEDPEEATTSRLARKAAMARWYGRGRAG
jgi:hypothetical protein